MKIKETLHTDDEGCGSIKIEIDGEERFSAADGEPEDNSLGRNFSDCYNILDMIKAAHAAGTRGEPLDVESVETSDDVDLDEE